MDKKQTINEIKLFLDGYNNDLKYLVHVEANNKSNVAECIIHAPGEEKKIVKIEFTPFLYTKDLKKNNIHLYSGDDVFFNSQMIKCGLQIEKQETGNQKKLEDGYCYKVTSHKSYNHILKFFREGGIDPYEKLEDENGNILKDKRGDYIYPNRHLFFNVRPAEQFFIDRKARLFKGFEEYKDIHRVTFDIETTGLRPEISRVFSIGVRDNKGFETILSVAKNNDDDAEADLIRDCFNLMAILKPAIIGGYYSEDFDFPYLLARAKILNVDITKFQTTLKKDTTIKRRLRASVKIGGKSEKYTATEMWGIAVVDILHAVRRTAAINSDIKETNLKYIAKFEKVAKKDRTYIPGENNSIGRYHHENPYFVASEKNQYLEVPENFQDSVKKLVDLKNNDQYEIGKKQILDNDPEFVDWFRKEAIPQKMTKFIEGKKLVEQYLKDDLWETEQIDELYSQSSFMLTKIVPTTFPRICTMGTASIWNLLLTAWSYDRGIAIPHPEKYKHFSGGLSRCYIKGFVERIVKIDYSSLYPFLQLTHDIFPIFDISGVMKKMLIYLTTARNIYKKLGSGKSMNEEELELLINVDNESYLKYINNTITKKDRDLFNIKQLPIKILNNSQYGALGANVAFNWSDNDCASRITCSGRIELRHAVNWFSKFGCIPLYAVTDGVNFNVPITTNIQITNEGVTEGVTEGLIEHMWKYNEEVGINALIEKFNEEEMKKPFMSVDNDGEFVSCYNLSRINYAVLQEFKDKETNELKRKIKYTGNSIKSTVMPEYVEDFFYRGFEMLLEGRGVDFVEYYQDYAQQIFYKRIPLKKIASKSRYKHTLKQYLNRGNDKNGRKKGKQAHMELIIRQRENIAEELFQKHKEDLNLKKDEAKLTIKDKLKLVEFFMPPEPELDSTLYHYNTGYRKSHGDTSMVTDKTTKEKRHASMILTKEELVDNPELTGEYNIDKYLDAFNNKVELLLHAFDPEIAEQIIVKISRKKIKNAKGEKIEEENLIINQFTSDQLELKSFNLDSVDESMYLEELEITFWNESGFDPRKVWDGFKMHDENPVYYEIYEHALDYLNDKMRKSGKSEIKSRNDDINKGDYVLLKSENKYSVGFNNGNYIEIIRENVEIPKTEIEIELEKKRLEKQRIIDENIEKLESENLESELIKTMEQKSKLRIEYFDAFKEKFGLPEEVNYGSFVSENGEEGAELIDIFVTEQERTRKFEANEFVNQ